MSKPKSAKASKPVGSRKPTAKPQTARQAVIRGPKPRHLRSVAPASAKPSPMLHSRLDAALLEKPVTAIPVSEKPMVSDDASQSPMRQNDLPKAFNVFSATANVGVYQKKLQEIAQAHMQLAIQFVQRLAQIKSPFEMPGVFAELATQQLAIFQNLVVLPNHGTRTPRA